MPKYKSSFQDEWLVNENYICWVKKTNDKHNKHKAYCTICLKEFPVLGQCIKALDVHAEGKGHEEKHKQTDNQNKLTFVAKNSEETLEETVRPKQQEKIDTMMIKTATLKPEIIWSLEVLMSNYSFNSCAYKSDLFAVMFEDSQIAQSFSLGSTKLSYNITFGLAPYVKNLLPESVDEVKYSLSFDESYNRIMKKGQMDLLIRFWDSAKDRVQTRYLDSSCLGKASANDIYEKFTSAAKGTCGLHTLRNAFSHGAKANSWKLKELLSAMYKIFDENPSRQADYESLTSATDKDYALKFCSHRWIENELVARRAQKIWPKYVEIIEFWRGLPKSKQPGKGKEGQNKSYDRLIEHQKDVLVPLKVAKQLSSFIIKFQTDSPMVPFLIESLESTIQKFCSMFILTDVLEKAQSTVKLLKLNVTDKNIHKTDFEFSFAIKHELCVLKRDGKISDSLI